VHFAFDERQIEFRDQLRAFAEKQCTGVDLRAAWASELGWSSARWQALADMGVVGLSVPEVYGGLGFDEVDLALLLEEVGRSGLPEPLLETTALGVPLLAEVPGEVGEAARERWLARVAAGEAVLTFGMSSATGVSSVPGAQLLLLEHEGTVHAVDVDTVRHEPLPSVDGSRRLARVAWDPSSSTALATGAVGETLVARTLDRAAFAAASILIGVADRLITVATAYAIERHQFGKAIGSFQAVKHHLSNALIRLEFARPIVYRAAWSIAERSPTSSRDASMAKAHASDAATLAARSALQVHGAIGYTWEHDLHLWMKRAWALAAAWGDAAQHRARVLELLVDEAPSP
jgi:alkylation response protein AidB-like acyl-CoA dehydrogenase